VQEHTVAIRRATLEDVAAIVALLADDPLDPHRESPDDLTPYWEAFLAIDADPDQLLVVAERRTEIVGTLQLTIIPGLTHHGARRAEIDGVRVGAAARGSGLGSMLIAWAVNEARRRGCKILQLTSDRSRDDAHEFYSRLGFEPNHLAFKFRLD
jgi:GNAT superfamily N-acetyltransferase